MMATMSDAHREWHRNTGVPMGTPGCPQDACHLPDEGPYDEEEVTMYEVVTPYGTEKVATLAEAKHLALYTAKVLGRAVTVRKAEKERVAA